MKDMPTTTDTVHIEFDVPQAAEKVWLAITDEDLLAQWLAAVDLRPQVGARFRLPPAEGADDAPMIDCEVVEVVPNRTLRWRQLERPSRDDTFAVESVVTLELLPRTHGTRLRIVHDQFRQASVQARSTQTNVVRFPRRWNTRCASAAKTTCALVTLRRAA